MRRNYAAARGKPVAVIGGAALEHYFAVVDQFAVCAGGVSLRRLVGIVAHSPHHQRAVYGKRYAAVYRKRAVQILLRRLLGVPRNAVYGVFRAARFRKGARRAIGNKQRHPDGNGQVFRYLFVPQQHHRVAAGGGCKRLLQVGVKYAVYACGIVVLRHYYGNVRLLVRHYHAERFLRGNKLARTVQPAVEGVAVAGRCRKRYSSALRYAVAAVDAARHRTVFAARDVVYDACPVEKAHVAYRRNIQPFRLAAVFGVGKVYRGLLVFGGGNFKGVLGPAAVVAYFFDVGTWLVVVSVVDVVSHAVHYVVAVSALRIKHHFHGESAAARHREGDKAEAAVHKAVARAVCHRAVRLRIIHPRRKVFHRFAVGIVERIGRGNDYFAAARDDKVGKVAFRHGNYLYVKHLAFQFAQSAVYRHVVQRRHVAEAYHPAAVVVHQFGYVAAVIGYYELFRYFGKVADGNAHGAVGAVGNLYYIAVLQFPLLLFAVHLYRGGNFRYGRRFDKPYVELNGAAVLAAESYPTVQTAGKQHVALVVAAEIYFHLLARIDGGCHGVGHCDVKIVAHAVYQRKHAARRNVSVFRYHVAVHVVDIQLSVFAVVVEHHVVRDCRFRRPEVHPHGAICPVRIEAQQYFVHALSQDGKGLPLGVFGTAAVHGV